MIPQKKPSKRIVSKVEYVQAHSKRIGLILGSIALFLTGIIGLSIIFGNWFIYGLAHSKHSHQNDVSAWLVAGLFGFICLTMFDFELWYHRIRIRVNYIDPGIPYTHAITADLPAPDSLVRASQEPLQAQQNVLLRAATETTQGQEEQLLRASVGEQK